jgi:hypothetical protein
LSTVTRPLDGARLKARRADRHFQELEANLATDPGQDSLFFAQEFDPNNNTIEVTLQGVKDIPIGWSLMVADVAQNLRSALNYVAWELAVWNLAEQGTHREPDRSTQFPINTRARTFSDNYVGDIHPDHVRLIQELQPNGVRYLSQRSETELLHIPVEAIAGQHPLAQLADLTNEDKHRVLLTRGVAAYLTEVGHYTPIDCTINHAAVETIVTLENGAKWAGFDVTPNGPEPKVEVKDKIGDITVEFGSCRCTIGMLPVIRNTVVSIGNEFAALIE